MTSTIKNIIPFVSILSLLLIGCGSSDPHKLTLPENAETTIHYNSNSLAKKGEWQSLSKEWFPLDSLSSREDSVWIKMMSAQEPTGIDLSKGLFLSSAFAGAGHYLALQGSLKDSTAFSSFMKSLQSYESIRYEEDLHLFPLNNYTVMVWNAHRFLCISDAPYISAEIKARENTMEYIPPYSLATDSLALIATQIFQGEEMRSLMDDERFTALLQTEGDLHIWTNADRTERTITNGLMGSLTLPHLPEGCRSAMQVRFENGQVRSESIQYLNEEWTSLLENDPPPPLSEALIDRIPANYTTVVAGFSLPPAALRRILKGQSFTEWMGSLQSGASAAADNWAGNLKGTVLIALAMNSTPEMQSHPFLALTVKDKRTMEDLFLRSREQDSAGPATGSFTLRLTAHATSDDWFAAGDRPADLTAFLSGKTSGHPYAKKMDGTLFTLYADLLPLYGPHLKNAAEASDQTPLIKTLMIASRRGQKGQWSTTTTLQLTDPQTNSLLQLTR